jgi:hypothetical protein
MEQTTMTGRTSGLDARFVPQTDVHAQVLLGEAVLLDVRNGTYFGLNGVGTRIWELLAQGQTVGEVLVALSAEFDVEPGTLERDVSSFVRALELRGLVQHHDGRAEPRTLDIVES